MKKKIEPTPQKNQTADTKLFNVNNEYVIVKTSKSRFHQLDKIFKRRNIFS